MDAVHHPEEKRTRVTLLVSPIKGPRMDWLVEKATELGVDRILPTIFKRTVVKFKDGEARSASDGEGSLIEASRQSGRFSIPSSAPTPLARRAPLRRSFDNRWLLHEREKGTTMRDILATQKNGAICVAIGPEGGVAEEEVEWLKDRDLCRAPWGRASSRTETAPLVVLSIIFYELNMR